MLYRFLCQIFCTIVLLAMGLGIRGQDSSIAHINTKKWVLGGVQAGLWGGTFYSLNKTWYADYPRSDFHFYNDWKEWQQMDDEAIIAELIAIRGIGRWTAEMFLIFHLMRPNILPLDDVGLINGISKNYFSGEPVSRSDAREVAQAWQPYSTVATWYIWRSLDPLPVEY